MFKKIGEIFKKDKSGSKCTDDRVDKANRIISYIKEGDFSKIRLSNQLSKEVIQNSIAQGDIEIIVEKNVVLIKSGDEALMLPTGESVLKYLDIDES